jgi:hypothetical protein
MNEITGHIPTTAERFRTLPHIVQLVDFIAGSYTLFNSADGAAYLSMRVGFDGQRAAPARGPFVRSLLIDEFCKIHHRPPSIDNLRMALHTIEAKAL